MLSAALLVLMVADKPLCTKKIQGQMWPTVANEDKGLLLTLARAGSLEMCVPSTWGYKWEHLTVNIHQAPARTSAHQE
jgi:hypothetical protein